ncbi:hypothetical protein Hypma_010492 [Hypsizygus marmoreus]|uniref:F-box domain-containing protein n=1 Tax=Hypsizygus marmoreus TaxID=39966 RepID=A0A369JPK9_HYPMA|nr:hypothetical protein Hypma_010492 [Hypsizygus marmoreus]
MFVLRPVLPHDILRMVFEEAASQDRKTALKLAVVSRLAQHWIELILYSSVNLHRETTCRAFLRTIETSRMKPRSFFATHVKSLCISYDFYDSRTARIITACQGVTTLTFWVIPTSWPSTICRPPHEITEALGPLRPKKLSVLLHGLLCSPYPRFNTPFFERITHLSVINGWEDWSTWWGFDLLPCLTHLSFELRVGPRCLEEKTAFVISRVVQNILARCTHLRVCVLLLIFDSSPTSTVVTVSSAMSTQDPRLVFMRDSEPFLDREAHSVREADIWKRAERTVAQQKSDAGYIILEI